MAESRITSLAAALRAGIAAVEAGDESAERITALKADFLELLELLKLFLISERDSYYGYFLLSLRFEADCYTPSVAGIRLNSVPPLLCANPLLLGKYPLPEILYILCHEIDHVVFNHPAEMLKAAPDGDPETLEKFNYAADAAVNDRLDLEIAAEGHLFLRGPEGRVTSPVLSAVFALPKLPPRLSYADYFAFLRDLPLPAEPSHVADNHPSDKTEHTKETAAAESAGSRPLMTEARCAGQRIDHAWEAGENAEEAAAAVRGALNRAAELMNPETRGMMSAAFQTQLELLNAPPRLPWQELLKRFIGTVPTEKRKTRARLNRRQPERFDLSGRMEDRVLKLVIALDTSGSITDMQLSQFFREIFAILARRRCELTVIECDAAVQRVYPVRSAADLQPRVQGRGGTAFTPVIHYLNEHREYRDALLIYFTDGFGEPAIPRPLVARTLWVITGSPENLSLQDPFGTVVSLQE